MGPWGPNIAVEGIVLRVHGQTYRFKTQDGAELAAAAARRAETWVRRDLACPICHAEGGAHAAGCELLDPVRLREERDHYRERCMEAEGEAHRYEQRVKLLERRNQVAGEVMLGKRDADIKWFPYDSRRKR